MSRAALAPQPQSATRFTWQDGVVIGLISCAGIGLVLYATSRYGAALSPDAAGYAGAARNLLAGKGLLTYEGQPLVEQPPVYPLLLALVAWLVRSDPVAIVPAVNAALLAGTLALTGVMLTRHVQHAAIRWIALIWLLTTAPVRGVMWHLLTEPLFVFLVTLWLLLADFVLFRYANKGNVWGVILLGIVAALATLTRYVGMALIASGVLLLLFDRRKQWRERLWQSALFASVAAMPVGLWLMRNWHLTGTLMGVRTRTRFTLQENLALVVQTMAQWVVPVDDLRQLPGVLGLGIVGAHDVTGAKSAHSPSLIPYWVFALLYLALVIFSASTVAFDPIGNRLLVPLVLPLCVLGAAGIDRLCRDWGMRGYRWATNLVVVLFALLALANGTATLVTARIATEEGTGGYHRTGWMESEALAALKADKLEPALPIYSNAHDALYLLLNWEAKLSPAKRANNSIADPVAEAAQREALRGVWPPEGDVWLIWLNRQGRDYLFTPEELAGIAAVEVVAEYEDGAVYRVRR